MSNMDLYKKTSGVIMMETILTLPIYIILLACVFYLGELCISRLTVTHGERLRLWESGLRHIDDDSVGVSDIFYFSFAGDPMFIQITEFSSVADFSAQNTDDGWGQIRTGKAKAYSQRSQWSWEANVSAENATSYGSSTTPPRDPLLMSSRDRDNTNNWTNVQLLSRTNSAIRNNNSDNFYETQTWQKNIYLAKWDSFIVPEAQGELYSVKTYPRVEKYLTWSE